MAADIGESAREKISEYNDRIRAVIDGKPLKINDKLEDLKIDFQRFTSIEWTEDFNLDKLQRLRVTEIFIELKTSRRAGCFL